MESKPILNQEERAIAFFNPTIAGQLAWSLYQKQLTSQEDVSSLKEITQIDSLTGLLNRSVLHDRFVTTIQRTSRSNEITKENKQRGLALVFLDLDGFKGVNDSYGHLAGDVVLVETADRMQESIRSTDDAFRFGGDEFAVILSDVSTGAIQRKIDELQTRLCDEIFIDGVTTVSVGASLGTLIIDADTVNHLSRLGEDARLTEINQMIAKVDKQMFKEKQDRKASGTTRYHLTAPLADAELRSAIAPPLIAIG